MKKLNNPTTFKTEIGGRELRLETGRLAKQTAGSVCLTYGETVALVTVCYDTKVNENLDFFPLTLEFQERYAAAGRIPGGFFKREGRPSAWATLNARMVDRPIRPLFPKEFKNPTQIVITLLSYDTENEAEALTTLGASAALCISELPFETPVASVRVARIDGELKVNPSEALQEGADINIIVAGSADSIMMVEGGADSVPEEDFLEALFFAHEQIQVLIELQKKLIAQFKCEKIKVEKATVDSSLLEAGKAKTAQINEALAVADKIERYKVLGKIKSAFVEEHCGSIADPVEKKAKSKEVGGVFDKVKKDLAREITFAGKRIDGRDYDQVRPIEIEIGWLPRSHGSALFTRGETQANVSVTLGTSEDEQMIDGVKGKEFKNFMLHYTFPPYCVGETGRFGGGSRREIGHGTLAERAVTAVLPEHEAFPYTVRVNSDVFESNGSSSMATVCGASLAMMDAGIPIQHAVAGIAMGLMSDGERTCVLSDILGDEDHLGDMDFKVCGTQKGITAVQMDIKMDGIAKELMQKALMQAREGRLHILAEMQKAIESPRTELSQYAPQITSLMISKERIKDLIGPGGKNIKNIISVTGCKVDIDDDGKVNIASTDPEATKQAIQMVKDLTAEAEIGKTYKGTVKKIMNFGAFVEIMPGTEGLCHISELEHKRVEAVEDVLNEGDEVDVKVLEVDARSGKIRLSRKALLSAEA